MLGLPESNGYIYVEANGGLNQQRTSVVTLPQWFLITIYILQSFINCYLELPTHDSLSFIFLFFRYATQLPLLVFWMLLLSSQISISIAFGEILGLLAEHSCNCNVWVFKFSRMLKAHFFFFASFVSLYFHFLHIFAL